MLNLNLSWLCRFWYFPRRIPERGSIQFEESMKIQVLGASGAKCKSLEDVVEEAADELGLAYQLEKITDTQKIANFGASSTPALAIDGKLKIIGNLPSVSDIKGVLRAKR
jgi:small redox-active disulfide protein 2